MRMPRHPTGPFLPLRLQACSGGDPAQKVREQGAPAGEKNLQGALQGGDTSEKQEGQHRLSSAHQGRKEGGVEPCSLGPWNHMQSCLQEGATIVANPAEPKGMSAWKAPELTSPPLGEVVPEGTGSIQPEGGLMRPPGANANMHGAPPLQPCLQDPTCERIANGMRGKDSTVGSTDAATMKQQPMSASTGCERDRERMGGGTGTSGTAASSCNVARSAGRVPLRHNASVIGGMEDRVQAYLEKKPSAFGQLFPWIVWVLETSERPAAHYYSCRVRLSWFPDEFSMFGEFSIFKSPV